jgi:hypothetical protein
MDIKRASYRWNESTLIFFTKSEQSPGLYIEWCIQHFNLDKHNLAVEQVQLRKESPRPYASRQEQ